MPAPPYSGTQPPRVHCVDCGDVPRDERIGLCQAHATMRRELAATADSRRRNALVAQALAKLTDEEREALGV